MKFYSFSMFFLLFILSTCQPVSKGTPPPVDKRHQTTPPARLYFKNIRSTAYTITTQAHPEVDQYRLRNWPDTAQAAFILPTIIDNWLYDQAYLSLQWVAAGQQQPDPPYTIMVKQNDSMEYLSLSDQRWGSQHDFAISLYEHLLTNKSCYLLLPDSSSVPIFTTEDVRSLYRITINDYRKLTE